MFRERPLSDLSVVCLVSECVSVLSRVTRNSATQQGFLVKTNRMGDKETPSIRRGTRNREPSVKAWEMASGAEQAVV